MVKRVLPFLIATITIACGKIESSDAKSSCSNRLRGDWQFGRAPYGCGISEKAGAPLAAKYGSLTFDDGAQRVGETERFTKEMHEFLVDYSVSYFNRRSPDADSKAVEKWIQLVLSTAHQESFWTNYRIGKDNLFRYFKGDANHGYGMMQIDDRAHKKFIKSNKVYDLNEHMVYALDILYGARQAAIKKPCKKGGSGADSINRSAYSAYNGGPGAKCRWTGYSKWGRNDKNFLQKYHGKKWEKYVGRAVAANDQPVSPGK